MVESTKKSSKVNGTQFTPIVTRSTCRAHAFWPCRACRTARLDTLNRSYQDATSQVEFGFYSAEKRWGGGVEAPLLFVEDFRASASKIVT